jgi:hypothetical protein
MRRGGVLFLLVLAAGGAAFGLRTIPALNGAGADADAIAVVDVAGRREAARSWRGPSAVEAAKLEQALAQYRHGAAPAAPPRGLSEEKPGTFAGRVPWDEVQALFTWAAERREPVLEIDVRAVEGDPARAACRVVLGKAESP